MTREEAVKKHAEAVHDIRQMYFYEQVDISRVFIKGMEALGLIKFEEEPKYDKTLLSVIHECRSYDLNDEFLNELAKRGYKVVPNG